MDDVRHLAETDHNTHKAFFFFFNFITNANGIYQSKYEIYEIVSH